MLDMTPDDLAKQVKDEIKSTYTALDKKTADLGEVIDEIKKKVEAKADTTDLDGRMKGLNDEVKRLATLADDLDKKMARPGRGDDVARKSLADQVMESPQFDRFVKDRGGKMVFETKQVLTSDVAVGSQTLYPGIPRQSAPLVMQERIDLTIRDLLPVGTTSSNAIEYARELAVAQNAATVAEGALKPETNFDFDMQTVPVRTIAHWTRVSKQLLDDMQMLRGYIGNRLTYGLKLVEEAQILNGDNAGTNLHGVRTQASLFPASAATSRIPGGTAATQVDVLRWAKLQVRQSLYPADAVVLNPEDWAAIELRKDAEARYIFSAFASGAEPRLWGMRVVESDAMPVGQFLVGAFRLGAQLWDREQANVQLSTEDRDNFVTNMITIRAEERLALTVYRPSAFVRGSFTLAA